MRTSLEIDRRLRLRHAAAAFFLLLGVGCSASPAAAPAATQAPAAPAATAPAAAAVAPAASPSASAAASSAPAGAASPSAIGAASTAVSAAASTAVSGAPGAVSAASTAVSGAVAAVAPAAPAALPTVSGAPVHVTFATTNGASGSAPVYIAMARGYFSQVGIDLELVSFQGGAQMIPSIAASQVDIANTDAGAGLLNAIGHDLPMKFAADGAQCTVGHCTTAFLVRKDLYDAGGFKSLADLKGKTVNTFTPGSTLYMYLYRMLDKAGLKDTDLNLQTITFDQVLPAFTTKVVDASWQIDPFTTQGLTSGVAAKFGDGAEILGPQQSTVIVYSPNFASQKQDAGRRFMLGYLRGVRDYDDAFVNGTGRDAIVDILTKSTTLTDPALYAKVSVPVFDRNGAILIDSLKTNQNWYVGHGDVITPVDLDGTYDQSYINYAVGILGKQ